MYARSPFWAMSSPTSSSFGVTRIPPGQIASIIFSMTIVTPNAYSTVSSGTDGSFEIPDVPPGKYELTAWHETLGSLTKNITVGNDGLNVNFDFLEVPQQEAKR